jgi:type 1 fimbriae regulatory protein FimB/type 1 fimbriae regulatory protein FimE
MILIAYRHGLRASELCGLRWDQIELNTGRLHVRRAKGGIDNVHPLSVRLKMISFDLKLLRAVA